LKPGAAFAPPKPSPSGNVACVESVLAVTYTVPLPSIARLAGEKSPPLPPRKVA
jgi:hypothetical protein